jgi:hypothetical protein
MSLDVYLEVPRVWEDGEHRCNCEWCGHGGSRETTQVFWRNTTHNHGAIADALGCYDAVWRPDENGISKAAQLIEPLRAAVDEITGNHTAYVHLNPPNGWGSVDSFTGFLRAYLAACEEHPDADVRVSR